MRVSKNERLKKKTDFVPTQVIHPLSSADIIIFLKKSATFVLSRATDMDCMLIYTLQFFLFYLSIL